MVEITIRWDSEYAVLCDDFTQFGDMRVTLHTRKGQLLEKYVVRKGLSRKVAVYTVDGECVRNSGFNPEQVQFIEDYCKRHKNDIIEEVKDGYVKPSRMWK